jgi:membrane protease YdiL (CAAX protease family)
MTRLSGLARRRPLLTFFVFSYALSWALWIPLAVFGEAVPGNVGLLALLIGSNVPSAMAIFLTVLTGRNGATRGLLGQLLIWRVGARWYLVLLGPTVLVLGAITCVAVFRGGPTAALAVPIGSAIFTVAFMTFPGSALGEEIGWRGFALPRLQYGRSALTATLVLGTLHALWHLPLWLRGLPNYPQPHLYPAFAIQVIALAVIYTWLYNSTRGSLLLAVLLHTATNAPVTLVLLPLGIDDYALPFWLMTAGTVLAAIVVVAVFGPAQLSLHGRPQHQPLENSVESPAEHAHSPGSGAS